LSVFPSDRSGERRGLWERTLSGDLSARQSDLLDDLTELPRGSAGVLYFDSCGGSVYTGLALATLLRVRRLRVTGVVLGECSSAALLPLASCQSRFVSAYATLLFHPMRWQSDEEVRLEEATEWARHFQELETRLDSLLSALLQVPLETLQAWSRPGRFISGSEFAAAGLAVCFDPFQDPDPWKSITRR
jgi:ATP-dependent protease ClpP protease subunit